MSWIKSLDEKLSGAPDSVLTLGLVLAGVIAILIGLYGTPTFKAVALAWMIAP